MGRVSSSLESVLFALPVVLEDKYLLSLWSGKPKEY